MEEIRRVKLEELLSHWAASDSLLRVQVGDVDSVLSRENRLRKFLHPGIVRRLDAGFARSNTVHPDTGRALYAICRAVAPACVFETGTYWGYSTAYLAAAVRDSGHGMVHTFDIYARAGKHLPHALRPHVQMHRGLPSVECMPQVLEACAPGLFFQDSRHDYEGVLEELQMAAPCMQPGSVILVHDFVEPEVRRAVRQALKEDEYKACVLDGADPQQLCVAIKTRCTE